jgi:hypothetical protein
MAAKLKAALDTPLGDEDIRKMLGQNIKIWNYPQLQTVPRVEDLFDNQGRAIILFPNVAANVGHWCALIRRRGRIDFFDPYGDAPDRQFSGISETKLKKLDVDYPWLSRLLMQSPLPVWYNTHPFQSSKPNVATCGRHCVVRLMYAPLSTAAYLQMIRKSKLTPDEFVVGATYDKIRK